VLLLLFAACYARSNFVWVPSVVLVLSVAALLLDFLEVLYGHVPSSPGLALAILTNVVLIATAGAALLDR
jgi:hypothetical protein